MLLKDNAWLFNCGKCWTTKTNEVHCFESAKLRTFKINNPNHWMCAALFLPGFLVRWTGALGQDMLFLNMTNMSGWLQCCQTALREHLWVEVSYTKRKGGFSSSLIQRKRWQLHLSTAEWKQSNWGNWETYHTLGRSSMVLHNTRKTSEMSPVLALKISTQKWEHILSNAISPGWKAIGSTRHCHCSLLAWRKSSSNLKLLGRTKEHDETQCLHGQPERKLPQFSHLPTGKDAPMLSKNYSLQVVCTPLINKTHR